MMDSVNYPEDVRGHSCLLLGSGDGGRPIHVVCSPKPEYLAIITAYDDPDRGKFSAPPALGACAGGTGVALRGVGDQQRQVHACDDELRGD